MIATLSALPVWLKAALASVVAGALIGVLAGSLGSGRGSAARGFNLEEPWSGRSVAFDELMSTMLSSEIWSRGEAPPAEPQEEAEAAPEPLDPTRPGAFKYLQLIAILRNSTSQAVFRPQNMPEEMQRLMVSSPDEVGLVRASVGSEIVEGWIVSDISDATLVITERDGQQELTYRLFDWQKIDE